MQSHELLAWIIRGSIVVILGYALSRILQFWSATIAHRISIVTLIVAALQPVFGWGLPAWNWTRPAWTVASPSANPLPTHHTLPANSGPALDQTSLPFVAAPDAPEPATVVVVSNARRQFESSTLPLGSDARVLAPTLRTTAAEADTPTMFATGSFFVLRSPWLVAWFAVFLCLATRLTVGLFQLWRFVRSCQPPDQAVLQAVDQASRQLSVPRKIHVVTSTRDAMPMACWLGRWTIVLPLDIETWDSQQRQAVIAHEIGHIARRDAWSDLLSNGIACLFWPHPVVWLLAKNITRLRERACDEWVLQKSTLDERTYALSLLAVVQRCTTLPSTGAVCTMAGRNDLESRFRWLMSASRPKTASPYAATLIVGVMTACGLAVATGNPVDPRPDAAIVKEATAATTVMASKEPTPKSPAISVAGTVVEDTTGRPVAGADVVLRAQIHTYSFPAVRHGRDVLARTRTDANGRYQFDRIGIPPRATDVLGKLRSGKGGIELVAFAEGKALQWIELPTFENDDHEVRLSKEAEVTGIVVGKDGRPVAGAELLLQSIHKGQSVLNAVLSDSENLNLFSMLRFVTTTDENGHFQMSNVPQDYRNLVTCAGPTGQQGHFVVDTGNHDFKTVTFSHGPDKVFSVHRTPIRFQTEQKPWVRVRVVDHDGQPVESGAIEAIDKSRHYAGTAIVDKSGSATLIVNKPGTHTLHYAADPMLSRLGARVEEIDISDIADASRQVLEIRLPKTQLITGKVVDADTGSPIVGAWVHSKAYAVTDEQGMFRLPADVGEHTIRIAHQIDGYFASTMHTRHRSEESIANFPSVVVAEGSDVKNVVLKVSRGLVVRGVVVDADGKPQTGVPVHASNDDVYWPIGSKTDAKGKFELRALSPYAKTRIATSTKSGAAEVTLPATPDLPREKTRFETITLQIESGTVLTGRVVHQGKPVAGVTMILRKAPPRVEGQDWTRFVEFGEQKTGDDGRYSFNGMKIGEQYQFEVQAPGNLQVRDWTHQSPYSQTVELEGTIDLPDARLVSNGQTLRGVVVDPDDNPVSGVTVSARLKSGQHLSRPLRGAPPWAETGNDGRFDISNLPEEPIVLMAYRANPAGGRILYPSNLPVELYANNIRIVLDPKLGSGIQDLDSP